MRVGEQVDERSLDLGGIDLDERDLARQLHLDRDRIRVDACERLADELVDGDEFGARTSRSGLEPGEVEEVGHEPVQAAGLDSKCLELAPPIVSGEL